MTLGLALAARGQVAFLAPGVCPAPPLWLWALCSCCFFPWCQAVVSCFDLVALRAVGCRVCCFVCFRRPRARWVFLVVAGCSGPCSCAPVLVLLVCARGPALFVLECAFWGFLPLFPLLHLFPLLRLFVTLNRGTLPCFLSVVRSTLSVVRSTPCICSTSSGTSLLHSMPPPP